MEQMPEVESTAGTPPTDPMKFTRERLVEIREVWVEFAKSRAEAYKEKLPGVIKQYLEPKEAEPPDAASADGTTA